MRVLVFGKTGQLAGELARRAGRNVALIALDRASADLADPAACARAVRVQDADAVINAAAYTAVDAAETDEATAMTVNAAAPAAMARAAAAKGVPFLHLSTDYVFNGAGARPWRPEDPACPLSAYGRSKLAGERQVHAAGGAHAILRTSWLFAAHGRNFVKTVLRLSKTHARLPVVADQVGGPTPAAAAADALLVMAAALHRRAAPSGIYHFAGAPDVSRAAFARAIFAAAGRPVTVEDVPLTAHSAPAPRPANARLDCSGLEAAFGLGRPDWRLGLKRVLAELEVPA